MAVAVCAPMRRPGACVEPASAAAEGFGEQCRKQVLEFFRGGGLCLSRGARFLLEGIEPLLGVERGHRHFNRREAVLAERAVSVGTPW